MKRIATALLATAAALAATSARAETRVHIGVNVGAPVYRSAHVYSPAPVMDYCPPEPAVVYAPAPRGYWKDVTVKTWVPERWVMSTDRWGRSVRVCEPGHFVYRTERVWVDGGHDHGHGPAHGYRRHHR